MNEILKILSDDDSNFDELDNLLNDKRVNTSASTTNQEMNNGIEKDLQSKAERNATMSTDINNATTTSTTKPDDAKIKRQ